MRTFCVRVLVCVAASLALWVLPAQAQIVLSGQVTLDDGTPPPEPVLIERVCNGVTRPEGYTGSKGRFSIRLGQNT